MSLKLLHQIFNRVHFLVYRDGLIMTIRIIWKRQVSFVFCLKCFDAMKEQVRENLTSKI